MHRGHGYVDSPKSAETLCNSKHSSGPNRTDRRQQFPLPLVGLIATSFPLFGGRSQKSGLGKGLYNFLTPQLIVLWTSSFDPWFQYCSSFVYIPLSQLSVQCLCYWMGSVFPFHVTLHLLGHLSLHLLLLISELVILGCLRRTKTHFWKTC